MKGFWKIHLLILAAITLFSGCGQPLETETESETVQETMSWEADSIPEHRRPIRKLADKALMDKFGITDFSPYKIDMRQPYGEGYRVKYNLYIGGYNTYESYTVHLTAENDAVREITGEYGKYAKYLKTVTADAIAEAEDRLMQTLSSYENHRDHLFLSIDEEGYLCLSAEVIVEFETTDPTGMDHEHLFFSERICQ